MNGFAGNFVKCALRFDGKPGSDVNGFIDAIEIYKHCAQVSDMNALRGLPMLLDVVNLLRITFGPKKPAYLVYRELFSTEQDYKTTTDVCEKRPILSHLPADALSEKV
ncbi:hypothetical protein BDFB_013012 [Asbolus verrucosus]|uniref:Uncharacterized protein n=1 Tax=Asbolus verrucosus TaxID=1661398 RepID=A0A482VWG0_ASBVE|nr:hypothetical protein BDFB_013012 [Asbolus verrucosus]